MGFHRVFSILLLSITALIINGQLIARQKLTTSVRQTNARQTAGRSAVIKGVAVLKGDGPVNGVVSFEQVGNGPVRVSGQIIGLAPGQHGFHVHEFGDLSKGCESTGNHYNPFNQSHGAPHDKMRHAGDLGNIVADGTGLSLININDNHLKLMGPQSIIGRAVNVHEKPDDLGQGSDDMSRRSGNAGSRVACGVIALTKFYYIDIPDIHDYDSYQNYQPYIPQPYIPQQVPQQYVPQQVSQQYIPQQIPQQYVPQHIPEQYIPQPYIPQQVPQQYVPQQVSQQNILQHVPQQYTPQIALQQYIPQQIVAQQHIPQQYAIQHVQPHQYVPKSVVPFH